MKIIVTGGAGFIGSWVIRTLLAETDAHVINLDKITYAANPGVLGEFGNNPRHTFVKGDICDRDFLTSLFDHYQPNLILHLAAESHVDRSIDGPEVFLQTNIMGTAILLQVALPYWQKLSGEARDRFRFHHISTDEVYGALGKEGKFTEETPYNPSSPYSASKASSDHLVRAWHHTFGLPVLITNCSNNYGPYQFPEKLIPLMIANAVHDKPLPVYGTGQNVRDWLYVEDHARALWLVAIGGRVGETYNIGGYGEASNMFIVEHICDHVDACCPRANGTSRRDLITCVADRPGHDFRYAIDCGKITRELGWMPQETLSSGLKKTVDWYISNQAWWMDILKQRYDGARLGQTERMAA